MKKLLYLFVLISLVVAKPQRGGFYMKGSFYSDLSLLHYHNNESDSLGFNGMSTLSINARNNNRSFAKVDMAMEIKMPYGAFVQPTTPNDSTVVPVMSDYVIASLDGSVVLVDLRRLYTELYFENLELSVGRQNIDFGVGTIFSPIDKF